MARHIPFRIVGQCIDCGGEISANRNSKTLRCEACRSALSVIRLAATNAVHRAIEAGRIPPVREMVCTDCEAPAAEYDHRDYLRPLDVVPVCRDCNQRRGPANWRQSALAQPLA